MLYGEITGQAVGSLQSDQVELKFGPQGFAVFRLGPFNRTRWN